LSETNRDYLSRIYISSLDVAQVFVLETPGRCKIGCGDPARALRDAGEGAKIAFLAWCDPRFSDVIATVAREKVRDQSDPEDAERAIGLACQDLGAEIQTDAELKGSALATVDRIDGEFMRLLSGGKLKELNAAYRDYRLKKNAAGEKAQIYNSFVQAEKVKLVQKTAKLVASSRRMSTKLKAAIASTPHHTTAA
jgi:hypothetical protein